MIRNMAIGFIMTTTYSMLKSEIKALTTKIIMENIFNTGDLDKIKNTCIYQKLEEKANVAILNSIIS